MAPSRPVEHQPDRGAVARRHELDGGFRQAGLAQALRRARRWMARLERKLSEPPRRIAALPAFRHSAPASAVTFGPALVDDADDAERHAHALDGHAVRPRPAFGHGADRVLERGAPPRCRPPWPRPARHRAPAGRGRPPLSPAAARLGHILGIGGQNGGLLRPQGRRHGLRAPGLFAPSGRAPAGARRRAPPGRSRPWRRRYRRCLRCS